MKYKKLFDRIKKLEKEIEQLRNNTVKSLDDASSDSKFEVEIEKKDREQNAEEQPKQRDKTRYMFNGNVYLKNRLVLAVVKDYVSKNRKITCSELKTIFDKSLQGSIGVVEYESVAWKRKDYNVRFFAKDDEILRLIDGNMVVCSQWGILNIVNFTKRAEQLGYEIGQIVRE